MQWTILQPPLHHPVQICLKQVGANKFYHMAPRQTITRAPHRIVNRRIERERGGQKLLCELLTYIQYGHFRYTDTWYLVLPPKSDIQQSVLLRMITLLPMMRARMRAREFQIFYHCNWVWYFSSVTPKRKKRAPPPRKQAPPPTSRETRSSKKTETQKSIRKAAVLQPTPVTKQRTQAKRGSKKRWSTSW